MLEESATKRLPLVQRSEIEDVFLMRFAGERSKTIPSNTSLGLHFDSLEYAPSQDGLHVQVAGHLVMFDADDTEEGPCATLDVTYGVRLSVSDSEPITEDDVTGFMDSNLLFMLYPYFREAFHRNGQQMGLQGLVIPYMRRFGLTPGATDVQATPNGE